MDVNVFGKNIRIECKNQEIREILHEELKGYKIDEPAQCDINIYFTDKINIQDNYYNNPSINYTFRNGFLLNFSSCKVQYLFEKKELNIYIELDTRKKSIYKFRSISYRNNIENIGTLLHELVFVPITFFDNKKALIHASSMKSKSGEVVLFGGTGGVGKTSLELLLCKDLGYSFISDDIAVISEEHEIYPNLSYPKIYAYNVVGDIKLENKIFENKTYMDKFQWKLFKKFKGNSAVRRSISPSILYPSVEYGISKIDKYYMLVKTDTVKFIQVETLSINLAIELSFNIMKNEYHSILQHIIWYENNCKLLDVKPAITEKEIYNNWLNSYQNLFKKIECFTVKIPIGIKHNEFLDFMRENFKNE